jgi:hypothetical protein
MLVILFSCKKEFINESGNNSQLNTIKQQLKDSLSINDFKQLDFTKSVKLNSSHNNVTLLQIPFNDNNIEPHFILLKLEDNQLFSMGKIFSLSANQETIRKPGNLKFNGTINIYSLKRNLLITSSITNGYVDAFHQQSNSLSIVVVPTPTLPEVVLVASYPPSGSNWLYSYWLNTQSMFFQGDVSGGGNGWSLGGAFGGGGTGISNNGNPINIDYEPVENLAAIDIKKYIQCFTNIPDAGATCSIRILTDLPVDGEPTVFFDWQNGSPGHTFLQISKANGTQRIQQNIGFYPVSGWKNTLTTAPEDGKFVDNSGHEFNASLAMNLTPEQLQATLIHMQYLANFIRYDIDEYNCTDFALEVFNYKRGGNQLTIPKYDIPGGTAPGGTNTPQGLYQQLKKMQNPANAESNNIIIPGVKGFVGTSRGPCN